MKVKRVKHCKKHLQFYKTTFGFREPYQVLGNEFSIHHVWLIKFFPIDDFVPSFIYFWAKTLAKYPYYQPQNTGKLYFPLFLRHFKINISSFYFIIFSSVDLTFCQRALTCKINIKEQMCNYIGPQTQLFTTSCILSEGALLGPQLHGALLICKQYKLRKCPHKDEPVSAQECIQHMIGIIAQDFSCLYTVKNSE